MLFACSPHRPFGSLNVLAPLYHRAFAHAVPLPATLPILHWASSLPSELLPNFTHSEKLSLTSHIMSILLIIHAHSINGYNFFIYFCDYLNIASFLIRLEVP